MEQDLFQATVRVRDQGQGIPGERIGQLFQKFSQVHQSTGRRLSGTGLGLAICRGIVEAHGGRIWAESEGEGRGSTFSFTLPLVSESQTPSALTPPGAEGRSLIVRREQGKRCILAVDDEVQVLRYLDRCLDDSGYRAVVTSDPSKVVELVEAEQPDLVLLDLRLPGTSGFELLRRLREFSTVPVIFLTASLRDEDMVQALKTGADDYITRPFSPSELLARIEAVLRRRGATGQTDVRPPMVLHELTIDFANRRVTVGGREVSLTATEYRMFYELAINAGRVVTYDQLLRQVWGPEYTGETALVRSFIRNLRQKLGDTARRPRFILTERQVGYSMPKA